MTTYDAVLFDNDGVLIEPPAAKRQREAATTAFADCGIEEVDPDYLTDVAGGVRHDRLHEICEDLGLDAEVLWKARDRHDQRLQREDIAAGERSIYDDVVAIGDCEVPCGVVSNNHHAIVEFVLEHAGLSPHFETYYGRERSVAALRRKKPDPHYIERSIADLDAETALFVGDRRSDVVAAHNAGIDSVFLRRAHCRDVEFDGSSDGGFQNASDGGFENAPDGERGVSPTHEIETLHDLPALVRG